MLCIHFVTHSSIFQETLAGYSLFFGVIFFHGQCIICFYDLNLARSFREPAPVFLLWHTFGCAFAGIFRGASAYSLPASLPPGQAGKPGMPERVKEKGDTSPCRPRPLSLTVRSR